MSAVRKSLGLLMITLLVGSFVQRAQAADTPDKLKSAIRLIDEYKTPGTEAELSGIYPHPTDPNLYYVLANLRPPYRYGQKPVLPAIYRGSLLTVNREGKVLKATHLADDDFGGMVVTDKHVYVALTTAAEILKLDPETLSVQARFQLPFPAGGLGYDKERNVLIAQLYVEHPNLSVLDAETGAILKTLWSDESAMGLAKIDGDWLCTWASGWDPGSFSELRVIDQDTGHVRERTRLDGVHTSLAPATDGSGNPAFLSLVTVNSSTGETVIRKYQYTGEHNRTPAETSGIAETAKH